jgi:hypothetical protein
MYWLLSNICTFMGHTVVPFGLKHCCKSRKDAGSIRDGIMEIFLLNNSSVRTVALGLTQTLTEMSKRNISWG